MTLQMLIFGGGIETKSGFLLQITNYQKDKFQNKNIKIKWPFYKNLKSNFYICKFIYSKPLV